MREHPHRLTQTVLGWTLVIPSCEQILTKVSVVLFRLCERRAEAETRRVIGRKGSPAGENSLQSGRSMNTTPKGKDPLGVRSKRWSTPRSTPNAISVLTKAPSARSVSMNLTDCEKERR